MSDDHPTLPPPDPAGGPGQPNPPAYTQGYGQPAAGQPEYLQQGGGTPVPPAAREQSSGSGRRGLLVGGAVVGGLALAGAGAWAALTLSGGGPQPTEALPADTLGFVSIDLDPSAGQKIEAMKMLNRFPAFEEEFGLDPTDDIRKVIFDKALESAPCDDVTYDDDVAPWIGNRAAMAAVNGPEGKPAPVLVVQVTDEAEAESGLKKLDACGGEGDPIKFVTSDGWAVIAEDADTAQAVVDDAAEGNLADDETFQEWMGEVGDPGVITMYAAQDAAQAIYDAAGSDAVSMFDVSSSLADFKGMAATVRFNGGALEMEGVGTALPGASPDPGAGDLIADLPSDTAAALSFSLPEGWVDKLAEQMASYSGGEMTADEFMAEMSTQTGLDLPADLETLMGDAMALSVDSDIDIDALTNASDPSALPLGLKIKGDPEAIQGVLDKISPQLGPDAELLATDSEGDVIVLGPNADYRASLLESGSLGDSAEFAAAVPHGDDSSMVVFVNFDAGDGWLDQLVESDPTTAENIEPLSSLGISSWVDGETSHVVVKLTTE